MTMIAGIFSRTDRPPEEREREELSRSISRCPEDQVKAFSDEHSFFVKLDIGAFLGPGEFADRNGTLSLLAGEPLLGSGQRDRLQDLSAIHERAVTDDWDILREAEGTFCLVHYQPETPALSLVTDKLGIRPLYFWLDDKRVVFATALRILESLSFVPKKMDLRAVTEVVGLGAPLADRTPYDGISLLLPGEIVRFKKEKVERQHYWRWDDIEVENEPESARLDDVYEHFRLAIRRRNRSDRATAAYLSGGLDSRCVVAALCDDDVRTHTVNFARPGTQDHFLGNTFATRIGSIHQSIPRERGDSVPDYSSLMAQVLSATQRTAERTRLVWSGEGGSVLLGLVHLNNSIVDSMRARNVDEAIETYIQREQTDIPLKLFQPKIRAGVQDVISQGIYEELKKLNSADAGRNFYLFLMQNDQRRKLADHFENIDLHRLEFQLPFFDGAFVKSVVSTPLDICLRHRFYLKWLKLFPDPVAEVPWQAYPGHEPCPLPVSAELSYQWDKSYRADEDFSRRQKTIEQAGALLRSIDFPTRILNKRKLRLATWIHSRGWRDYEYAIKAAQTFCLYARKCGGDFTLSLQ
jgi:asparagine synthase (glutamine-hydrolysing)